DLDQPEDQDLQPCGNNHHGLTVYQSHKYDPTENRHGLIGLHKPGLSPAENRYGFKDRRRVPTSLQNIKGEMWHIAQRATGGPWHASIANPSSSLCRSLNRSLAHLSSGLNPTYNT
ncbi:hypothetical protein HAX54_048967, partial [Datura stramonium]|nr:hypothetical protein [Datura stramonium]